MSRHKAPKHLAAVRKVGKPAAEPKTTPNKGQDAALSKSAQKEQGSLVGGIWKFVKSTPAAISLTVFFYTLLSTFVSVTSGGVETVPMATPALLAPFTITNTSASSYSPTSPRPAK